VVVRVRESLRDLELPTALKDQAELLVSEMVTNSILHSGLRPEDEIRICATWSGTRLRVDVRDRHRTPRPSPLAGSIRPEPGAESGWGLYLVDRLASRWGIRSWGYWFELEIG
jgi:anti-sigma regulatory factor (Ser/Thr protein kinase)